MKNRLFAVIAAVLAGGPALAQTEIKATEYGSVIPSARMSFNIASPSGEHGPADRDQGDRPARRAPTHGHGSRHRLSGEATRRPRAGRC